MNSPDGFHDLILRAQRGERTAIGELLEVVRPWLWQAAKGFADSEWPDQSTADLAQAAWLRAWQSLGQFQGPGDGETDDAQSLAMFRAWIMQIVRRLGMNAVRDRQTDHRRPSGRLQRLDAAPPADDTATWGSPWSRTDEPSPSAHVEADERAELIRAALDKIADDLDRRIVRLRFFEGVSLREVAERLELNREEIRRRFHTAMRFLERELEGFR